jgi:FkbM family methyltransferase
MENRYYTDYYIRLYNDGSIPQQHIDYLYKIGESYTPTIIYDIGAAVLHWTKEAKIVWPNANYYNFEAVLQVEEFYKEMNTNYALGVFSDQDNKELIFYNHPLYLGGNSYYKENIKFSPAAKDIYNEASEEKRTTFTIDTVAKMKEFPLPDMVKIDVQGAELDILKGMTYTLSNVKHLIVELQHVEYNIGAKQVEDSIPFIEDLGFKLITPPNGNKYFCGNGPDADYHFIKL